MSRSGPPERVIAGAGLPLAVSVPTMAVFSGTVKAAALVKLGPPATLVRPKPEGDQSLVPSLLTARTWNSYSLPAVSPVMLDP